MSESHPVANGRGDRADSPNGVYPTEKLDAVIVGAGFAGVYILVRHYLAFRLSSTHVGWIVEDQD